MMLARRVEKKQLVKPPHYLIKNSKVASTATGLQKERKRERDGGNQL